MGNRAVIKTESGRFGIYLHWNGGRDSVEAFLTYCKMRGFRAPEQDGYGWARLAQVIGNFFGGGTSIGICETGGDDDGKWCDNGAYIIRDWEIVGRENFDGPEQDEYDLFDMMISIDEAQPEKERIGEYLKAVEVPAGDLKIGDTVVFMDWNGTVQTGEIVGIGSGIVNGQDMTGVPYMGIYGSDSCPVEKNSNNYIKTPTARKLAPKPAEESPKESPVEIFINEQLRGIELKFKARPSEEVRAELKASGWRWHHKKAVWYAKNDAEHMKKAQQIAAALTK